MGERPLLVSSPMRSEWPPTAIVSLKRLKPQQPQPQQPKQPQLLPQAGRGDGLQGAAANWTLPQLPHWPRHTLAPTTDASASAKRMQVTERNGVGANLRCGSMAASNVRFAFMGSCLRGTGAAIYNYADALDELLGLHSITFFCVRAHEPSLEPELQKRFGATQVRIIKRWPTSSKATDYLIAPFEITHLYMHKFGKPDGVHSKFACNLVHAVFDGRQPHGDRFARISEFVANTTDTSVVHYMVRPPIMGTSSLREAQGIPASATVFCRYGGLDSFNIHYVKELIIELAPAMPNAYFLFANTRRFCESPTGTPGACPPRIRFFEALLTDEAKNRFIRSCDAMIHARAEGETFGLAIAEFAMLGKRIITEWPASTASSWQPAGSGLPVHVRELGNRAIYYQNRSSLRNILLTFDRSVLQTGSWNGYVRYRREAVMREFQRVFLPEIHGLKKIRSDSD